MNISSSSLSVGIKYYRIKIPQTRKFNFLTVRIISAAHSRRRNHLRKKLQEQVSSSSSPSVELNPVLSNHESVPISEIISSSTTPCLPNPIINSNYAKFGGVFMVFCSFLVFIAFTKTTATQKEAPATSLDKEMLRRKLKARITRNSSGNATTATATSLVQYSQVQIPSSDMSHPQLDKQQLMDTIFELKSSHFDAKVMSSPHVTTTLDADSKKLDDNKLVSGRVITSVKEARKYLENKKIEKKQLNELDQISKKPKGLDFKDEKQECVNAKAGEELERANREKWMEDNFDEFKPIVDKIRGGFRNNYMVAKEKVKEDVDDIVSDLKMLQRDESETEFEWMKDEKLREIVFQVRENELMGRDPFYLMDGQDKALFFKGLEKKVEKENENLCRLHEYLHSNIENLDYGADGISLYDSPENIIPRWKGPPPATTTSQEYLDDYLHQRNALFAETLQNSDLVKSDPQVSLQSGKKTVESDKKLKSSKTVIEGSDGSVKPGKKSGKEFWQHTKKWSRGFVDSYNAENDSETKAVMKDIGKDLDRWITEKEIKATADIMDKVPDKGKKFIANKINKLKTEMELFGPQAVVSKYSEYGEEEEVDYYWWLDLPFLLCIELYIKGDEDERIGFYSLEMASDLELDPKPHHIIAFEDAADCKNFCYIMQAHLEMLGNGNAFVVPQLPKDTYQDAKANGFNVTVIRRGELKMDVDQTLEEVEEKLAEIGSKIYHDKIMKGRNVDVNSVMKGVFGLNKPPKRSTSKKKLKKPTK